MEKNNVKNKVQYYYLRMENSNYGEKGKPFGVVAIKENSDGTVNRGVSICSSADSFNKRAGRGIALKRLMQAEKNQTTEKFPTYLGKTPQNICYIKGIAGRVIERKYCYHDVATEHEYRMFHKPEGVK